MKIGIIHLSDLHFLSKRIENPILDRVDNIASALDSVVKNPSICFIVVSGDIAYSGKNAEFKIAKRFFKSLTASINARILDCAIEYVFVPGNHDCDFSKDNNVRDLILQEITPKVIDDSVIVQCTEVQNNYFNFIQEFIKDIEIDDPKSRLVQSIHHKVDQKIIEFVLFNTSFMSTENEKQGSLIFPDQYISKNTNTKSNLVISVLHHPYNWFESSSARTLRETLEETSDVVITGHEHETDLYIKSRPSGEQSEYIEGGVFQDSQNKFHSEFNILEIDVKNEVQYIHCFQWTKKNRYEEKEKSASLPLLRNSYRLRKEYSLKDEFEEFLNDPGAKFTHREKEVIYLDDIFIYPDLRLIDFPKSKEFKTSIIKENIPSFIIDQSKVLLIGTEKSGKTSLSKAIFRAFRSNSLIPIYLNGEKIKRPRKTHLSGLIQQAYENQYRTPDYIDFNQLSLSKRAIIVDDFHLVNVNPIGRDLIISYLESIFSVVVLVGGENLQFQDLIERESDENSILRYLYCEIMPLGHLRRSELIKKWYRLGRYLSRDTIEIGRQVIIAQRLVNELIGKNLTPTYPVYILVILQQIEAQTPLETTSATGSYGYLYESLLTVALSTSSKLNLDLDTQYSYLAELSYYIYQSQSKSVSKDDLFDWHQEFCKKYGLRLDLKDMTLNFNSAGIIEIVNNKTSFKYPYAYYYFIGRYFRDNLHDPDIKKILKSMSKRLHHRESANVLMFLTYLSKDPYILSTIIEAARELFLQFKEVDIVKDSGFLDNLSVEIPKLIIKGLDSEERHKEILEKKDEIEILDNKIKDEPKNLDEVDIDINLDLVLQVNVAFKTIQILGQILRNYPGSLDRYQKNELSKEAYSLGLRMLKFIYTSFEDNQEEIILRLIDLAKESHPKWDDEKIKGGVGQMLFYLLEALSFVTIKHVSDSIGFEPLSLIFDDVLNESSNISYKYIDMSIRLYHFHGFPEEEVFNLYKEVHKRIFGSHLLKQLVFFYFYIFPAKHDLLESVCKRLDIEIQPSLVFGSGSRKE